MDYIGKMKKKSYLIFIDLNEITIYKKQMKV